MRFQSPRPIIPTDSESELLLRFLQRQREEVVATVEGLTEEQARWTPGGRLLPIIGIINHLTHAEWRWIDGRYLRCPFPPREEEFQVGADASLMQVIDAYYTRAERTREVVREAPDLHAPCLGREGDLAAGHVLLGLSVPIDLRWVVLHLIEETAHHAGHADATREMLDGKRMRAG
jgi:Protein of unknown function (DUF664)